MADGSRKLESKKAPATTPAGASLFDPDKDYISTLFVELGQARAIVDLLFMVACGKAADSIDGMASGTLEGSLHIALQRLDAVHDAAKAILAEGRPVGLKQEAAAA
jgi:hypothetical protein